MVPVIVDSTLGANIGDVQRLVVELLHWLIDPLSIEFVKCRAQVVCNGADGSISRSLGQAPDSKDLFGGGGQRRYQEPGMLSFLAKGTASEGRKVCMDGGKLTSTKNSKGVRGLWECSDARRRRKRSTSSSAQGRKRKGVSNLNGQITCH